MKFLSPIPQRNYAQDPFVPVSFRSEESKRLEEEVKQKEEEVKADDEVKESDNDNSEIRVINI